MEENNEPIKAIIEENEPQPESISAVIEDNVHLGAEEEEKSLEKPKRARTQKQKDAFAKAQ
eukprot:COSAG05_NODE_17437_length_325_cov_0.827434_1_plen_60_part_10